MSLQQQLSLALGHEIIVDLFAGGGGASEGIRQAFGRDPDVAVNHDAIACAVHAANHPGAKHFKADVFEVDPIKATGGRPVGLLWASPDCKHFSKAKGGKPVSKRIRGLAWVVVKWAKLVKPRIICLENVEEFVTWGPVLANGKPCPERRGSTFERWKRELRALGYKLEHRELRACDFGAPTIRKRLFLIARRDGLPIRWPKPTHGKPGTSAVVAGKLAPWRSAAECIDWSLPCHSIFLTPEQARAVGVKRPLAEATLRRIWRGVDRFVVNAADPFIVPVTHPRDSRVHDLRDPLRTVTGANRGELALVAPVLAGVGGRAGQSAPRTPAAPYHTSTAKADTVLVTAYLAQQNGGFNETPGHDARAPVSTISSRGAQQQVVVSHLSKLYGTSTGADPAAPLPTITAGGNHIAEVRAFLIKFYGQGGQHSRCDEPMHTVPTRDRMGLVTVQGDDYVIADIGLRMLTPRELFNAQGFPPDYIIDIEVEIPLTKRRAGKTMVLKRIPKDAQVRLCGNSVCPPVARAIVEANVAELLAVEREAMSA